VYDTRFPAPGKRHYRTCSVALSPILQILKNDIDNDDKKSFSYTWPISHTEVLIKIKKNYETLVHVLIFGRGAVLLQNMYTAARSASLFSSAVLSNILCIDCCLAVRYAIKKQNSSCAYIIILSYWPQLQRLAHKEKRSICLVCYFLLI